MPKPIFVFGIHRSGTTWLSNQISEHSNIAAVQHEAHFGIHESGYFEFLYERFGDISQKVNFVELVEVASASDYFVLANVDRNFLYSLYPTTYEEFFRAVMNEFATQQGVEYWLEKTPKHTLMIDHIGKHFPDAIFVAVERDLKGFLSSHMRRMPAYKKGSISRYRFVLYHVVRWSYYNKLIKAFARKNPNRMYMVTYQDMLADLETVMKGIAEHMGVPYEEAMSQKRFRENTSFKSFQKKEEVLNNVEKQLASIAQFIVNVIPMGLLDVSSSLNARVKGRRNLPDWFFQLTRSTDEQGGFSQEDIVTSYEELMDLEASSPDKDAKDDEKAPEQAGSPPPANAES